MMNMIETFEKKPNTIVKISSVRALETDIRYNSKRPSGILMEVSNPMNIRDKSPGTPTSTKSSPIQPTWKTGLKAFILTGQLNTLLVFIPVALMSWGLDGPEIATFLFSLLSIAPLAERLGFVTEQLALHTNATIGGLLNVTFGNATELIVSIAALARGYYRLIQLSLLGSILSNMLLVLGCALYFGGIRYPIQKFNNSVAQINSTMLLLAVMGLLFPSVMHISAQAKDSALLDFSRCVSIILLIIYGAYIYTELSPHFLNSKITSNPEIKKSISLEKIRASSHVQNYDVVDGDHEDEKHSHHLADTPELTTEPDETKVQTIDLEANNNPRKSKQSDVQSAGSHDGDGEKGEGGEDDEDEEEDVLGFKGGLVWLGIVAILISILSEALVETIEEATEQAGINTVFISTIVLPIVGNAAEHASAVIFSMKNKVDLSLSIAIGSSTQIAVFVIPLLVLLSWCTGQTLDLNFHAYETYTLLVTVIIVTFGVQHGRSNWMMGLILLAAYVIISIGFYVHKDEKL